MSMLRDAIGSTRGKVVIGVLAAIVGWQVWLSATASGKLADTIPQD